ncbi:hypothetical protein HN587_05625 [Candidatus Woesearchaeota archaeon]|jgi:hypothetical protein|nr:hypothetical protein [Candidatus Woesearchaeota archaeon]
MNKSILTRINEVIREKGFFYVMHYTALGSLNIIKYVLSKLLKKNKFFIFQNKKYRYFIHSLTWNGERVVELPIIINFLNKYKNKKILEVGNVLSTYIHTKHDILDKYEKYTNVINEDVLTFKSNKKYDLIISISTLEHVGWDEKPKDTQKTFLAINNLKKQLSNNGTLIVTLPLGYHPLIDRKIKNKEKIFSKCFFLKRVSKNNNWKEIDLKNLKYIKYNSKYPYANEIIIGIINK